MCGIVGMVKLDPRDVVDETLLKRMRDVLRHRGPDGEGLWMEGRVGLGHRRLSIVDLATGQQPMTNEDGSCWIAFNGEIYNHAALRPGLEARGHRYRTRSDTESILHLYEDEQERCVEQLHGMFAFALWDRRRRRLLLARDRLGIKPLYYALTSRELVFASEIKAILAALEERPALNSAILPEFLATRYVAGEETFFRGVRKLLPGRTLSWSDGDAVVRTRRYWRLAVPEDGAPAGFAARARALEARLQAAVASHLMSDVPVGLFLSGGLDSSGLAALMAPLAPGPVRTFAVGFAEREANELGYARLAARAIGAEHHEVLVTPREFFEALPRLVWHEDEPPAFTSSVPLYFVARLAREHVKVVLTGEGSDELFLGYDRYRVTAWNLRLGAAWSAAPRGARTLARRLVARLPRPLRRVGSRSFLALDPGPRALFCENFSVFPPPLLHDVLEDPGTRDPYATALDAWAQAPGDPLRRMSHADVQTYLVELLMKQDQMSMAASVESRVPFLDHELVEHAAALPSNVKLRGLTPKAVLRRVLEDRVPRPILRRPKRGFPVPFDRWVRGDFWPVVEELVLGPRARARGLLRPEAVRRVAEEHRAGAWRHGDRLWLLVNLEIWQRIFLDGEDPDDIGRSTWTACASSG